MPLYSFNGAGHNAFTEALGRLREIDKPTPKDIALVKSLAMNPAFTEVTDKKVNLPSGPFPTRFELCSKLFDALEDSVAMDRLKPGDGIWSWLSAYYFEELTTFTSKKGKVKLSVSTEQEFPAYIWNANFKKAYRHRIGHGVFMIRHLGKELSKPMLLSAPGSMSDYCEQTFARVGSYREKTVIEAAHSIYFDGKQVIPGSSGERRWALQHLHRDVGQYLVNYELHEMRPDELLEFLPQPFKKQGFINWSAQAKVVAAFIATHDGIWKHLLGEATEGDPVELFAEQIGCTEKDLSKMVKEASAKLDLGRKGHTSSQHWAVEFETLIKNRRISPEDLATSVKKLLSAADPDDIGDELLDELIDLMDG
jgi:hypothetical protein